jgi:hypothetical protein
MLAGLLLTATLPLLWPPLPPLTDLPGHVGRWHIALAGPDSPLHRYYDIHWALIGNLGVDVLAIPLAHLIGLIPAAKLIVILIVPMTMASMLWLSREVHGRVPPTALFALPFVYAWPFQMGFVNFALAQGLGFAALALWLKLGRTGNLGLRAALFAPIGIALWVAHSAGWGLFGLMAFGAELARLREEGRRWPGAIGGAILACLPLALPIMIMIGFRSDAPRANSTGDWFNFPAKFLWVISSLRDRWQWFDIASLVGLLLVLYVGIRERRLGYARLLGWPALFCIGGFLLLPRLLLGGSYVDMRMMPAIWILALLAIRPPPPGRLANVLALAGLAFFAIRTAATTLSLLLVTTEQRTELAAVQHIPRGAPVLTLVYRPCLTPWSDARPEHLPAYAVIKRDAFVNEQWAIPGQHVLTIRHRSAMPFLADPSQLVYPVGCKDQGRDLPHAIATFPREGFSHVWIIGKRLSDPRRFGLVPVWTNGHSAIYEVVGGAGSRRVERTPER